MQIKSNILSFGSSVFTIVYITINEKRTAGCEVHDRRLLVIFVVVSAFGFEVHQGVQLLSTIANKTHTFKLIVIFGEHVCKPTCLRRNSTRNGLQERKYVIFRGLSRIGAIAFSS